MEKRSGFFKNVWTSIVDFEKYEEFATDRVTVSVQYIIVLTLIFVIAIGLAYTFKFYNVVADAKEYVEQSIDEIKFEEGKLKVSSEEPIIIENAENIIPVVIVDTSENVDTNKYLEKIKLYNMGVILLEDKIIMSNNLLEKEQYIYYSDVFSENIESKAELLEAISGNNMMYLYMIIVATIVVYLFAVYVLSNLLDAFILAALGYVFARIVNLRLRLKITFKIGLHAITLPIILNLIYIIVNTFTGFTIEYFQWMYTTISYIYVAVAILMIKTEIINQKIELIKLKQIQNEVAKEELKEEPEEKEKEEEKEEKKKDKKEEKGDKGGEQPEGSNA